MLKSSNSSSLVTYREPLTPVTAKSLLGEKYNKDYTYVLYSSRDEFVIGVIDSAGLQIDEIKLEQDTYTNEEEEPYKTQAQSLQEDLTANEIPFYLTVLKVVSWLGISVVILAAIAVIILIKVR